jgi:hypothetical protein
MSEGSTSNAGTPKDPAKANDELRWQLYNDHKKQAWEDIQSSTDSYDQSLLTLSSGALGLSIAFIKDIVPLHDATKLMLLYLSWVAFGFCILITVISFQVAKAAQNEHLGFCWKFYIGKEESFQSMQGKWSKVLNRCTIGAGTLFVFALAFTISFAIINVERRANMPDTDGARRLQEGRGAVSMTPVPPQPAPKPATPPPSPETQKKD